jgi:hypothetical protein
LVSVFSYHNNNDPALIISGLAKKEFRPGALKYKINLFGIIPMGDAVLGLARVEEYNGKKVYHLTAQAESLKIFSEFFNAHAVLDSYVDIEKLNPLLFKQRIAIAGKQDIVKEATYDQNNGIMSIAGVKRQILTDTQDPLSAIFNLRHMDLDRIREFELNINTNQKNYILKGTVSLQQVSVNKKIYKTALIKATIRRRDKNPYHQSALTMVLLREKENIPILIRVFASGMLINAKLIDIQNGYN